MDKTKSPAMSGLKSGAASWIIFGCTVTLGLCDLKSGVCILPLCLLIALGKPDFPVFAGAFLASVLTSGGTYIHTAVIMTVFGAEWLYDRKEKSFTPRIRLITSVLSALAVAGGELLGGNLIFENPLRAVSVFAFLPLSVAALSGLTDKKAKRARQELGILAAAFFVTAGAGVISAGGYSLGIAVASFLTLMLSKNGWVTGALAGFVCGMGCGIAYMPVLGILGFAAGMFGDTSPLFSRIFAFLLSGAVGCYLVGVADALPGLLCTAVGIAAYTLLATRLPELPQYSITRPEKTERTVLTESKLSAAFSSLSRVFFTVGEENAKLKKEGVSEKVRENVFALCEKCRGCSCDKYDLANGLTDTLWKKRLAVFADLPRHIQGSCKNTGELLFAANSAVAEGENGLKDGMNRLAEEYLAFSRLICSANRADNEESAGDAAKSRRVRELLHDKKIAFRSVSVVGKRRLRVTVRGVDPSKINIGSRELSYMLSTLLMTRLGEPEFVMTGQNGTEMRLSSLPVLRVECAKATVGKAGEAVCGDTVSFFESDGGYFYSLISDGMGSGREAELASRLASIFLEKLLELGAEAGETLKMLNRMLITKDEEVFTTVDLLEIDRMTGDARIIKAGAAPTFIYRQGECYRLDARTAPVGIISEVRAAETKLKLKRGDYIVMTSDGITPTDPKPSLPPTGESKTAAALAGAIINRWSESAATGDDMSVSVIRIA